MDTFYKREEAAVALETIAASRRLTLRAREEHTAVHMADIETERIVVSQTSQGRRSWRLCAKAGDEDVLDEIVLRIQGIVTKNNLVPRNLRSCTLAKAQFLSQHVEICGLDTATFEASMGQINAIHELFSDYLSGIDITPVPDGPNSTNCSLGAANRVFSRKYDLPTEQDNDFEPGLDPIGLLDKLKGTEFFHAPENMVKYFRRVKAATETQVKPVYEGFIPGAFKPGDIVEMQLCIVGVSAAKNSVKITTRLQALTLLDDTFTKAATIARAEAAVKHAVPTAVRRRVGYFHEDDQEERKAKKARSSEEIMQGVE
ncbi:hypothetical protein C8R47DRAFT_1221280 [Mycena vitilis]|nr:hypothetical protein C8R47DRAFT_1221280 [Mycena vitilis]